MKTLLIALTLLLAVSGAFAQQLPTVVSYQDTTIATTNWLSQLVYMGPRVAAKYVTVKNLGTSGKLGVCFSRKDTSSTNVDAKHLGKVIWIPSGGSYSWYTTQDSILTAASTGTIRKELDIDTR